MADTAEFYTDFVPTFYDWVKGKKRHILHVSALDFPTCWLDRNPGCLITALYIFDTATYADIRYGENGSKPIRFRWSEQEIPLERLLSIIQSSPNEAVVQYDEVIPADNELNMKDFKRIAPFDPFIKSDYISVFFPKGNREWHEYYIEYVVCPEAEDKDIYPSSVKQDRDYTWGDIHELDRKIERNLWDIDCRRVYGI